MATGRAILDSNPIDIDVPTTNPARDDEADPRADRR